MHGDITKSACDSWCAAKGGTLDPYCRRAYAFGRLARSGQLHAVHSVVCDCVKVEANLYETSMWPPPSLPNKQLPRPYMLNLDACLCKAEPGLNGEGYVDAVAKLICAYVDRAVDNFGQGVPIFGRSKSVKRKKQTMLIAWGP